MALQEEGSSIKVRRIKETKLRVAVIKEQG